MCELKYPNYNDYVLPKKNILVLSCIDLRLLDNLLNFLNHDNLTNRYDHFVLAGASLCTKVKDDDKFADHVKEKYGKFPEWAATFNHHLQVAIDLHQIKDVYIVEHMDCGAYKEFLQKGEVDTDEKEKKYHHDFAVRLAQDIFKESHEKLKLDKSGEPEIKNEKALKEKYHLEVHCFLINLRGDVELMYTTSKDEKLRTEVLKPITGA